jgi:murein DD-endopeptidase MepM/ murein hydrolase activator NlpD
VPKRLLAAFAAVAVAAGMLVTSAPAQAPEASAEAAVISGSLGRVARVRATGDDGTSRSVPSNTPDGIVLGDGFVAVSTSVSGALSATAQAEADDLELLGGLVTATIVSRSATDTGRGVRYRGSVRGLVVGDREIGTVRGEKTFRFDSGTVVANRGGAGLVVTLTAEVEGFPAGTKITVADVSARARGGAPTAEPTPTATRTAEPEPEPTASATPTATPRPRKPAGYKRRLMGRSLVFPVGGRTRIAGPFGSFRAQTGSHQGNDLFADFGTPVVAVADGTVENVGSLKISGNRLWLYADSGDQFFYAHLSSFAPDAVNGRHVEAGTVLGYTGNTGDAEPTPPHLHFEIHPEGGDAVDPNPFLVAWQKRAGAALTDTAERPGALVEVRDFIGEG